MKPAGVPISSMRPERGRHSESREALYCTLSGHTSDRQGEDLIQRRRHDSCHTSCHVSWMLVAMVFEPSTYLRNRKRNNIVWERQTLENIMEIMGNILTKIIYHENPILFKDISCFYKHAQKDRK